MDHCMLFSSNYSFDEHGASELSARLLDSGYDSLLHASSSSFSTSSSFYLSQPSTPTKLIHNGNNSSTTPDMKQQYVADVNSLYYASLRSSPASSMKSSEAYSNSSSSNSPFVHTRDNVASKLLRSPAFKLEAARDEARPVVRSFTARFGDAFSGPRPEPVAEPTPPRSTPTEEEFMQLLIKNRHIPENPECLIGRHVGVEHIDVLAELNKRSMSCVIESILAHLSVVDVVAVGCVSREWRQIVKQDPRRSKERTRYLRQCRRVYEENKENQGLSLCEIRQFERLGIAVDVETATRHRPLPPCLLAEKRAGFAARHAKSTADVDLMDDDGGGGDGGPATFHSMVFATLDANCIYHKAKPAPRARPLFEHRKLSLEEYILSPVKREPKPSPVKKILEKHNSNAKIDLICSKKSKRNLKRL